MSDPISSNSDHLPNPSEVFGNVRKASEGFGTVPNPSEAFRIVRNVSERTENHTLTVREVAKMFETSGVARTERSIINWCQPNPQGIARLDAYYDMNERKWFITPESVDRAIAEEKAKAIRHNELLPDPSEAIADVPKTSEKRRTYEADGREEDLGLIGELEKEVYDLKITNRAKDFFIDQFQKERESFALERQSFVEKLMTFNRRVGELETELRQLAAPRNRSEREGDYHAKEEPDIALPDSSVV